MIHSSRLLLVGLSCIDLGPFISRVRAARAVIGSIDFSARSTNEELRRVIHELRDVIAEGNVHHAQSGDYVGERIALGNRGLTAANGQRILASRRTLPVWSRRLKVLHIVLSISETNAAYNEHCLPLMDERDITICTFFGSGLIPPAKIHGLQGNGSVLGFFRVLRRAVDGEKYDVVHAHSPHVALLFLLARLLGIIRSSAVTVVTVHDCFPNYKFRNRLLLLPVFALFDSVVCCSNASLDSIPNGYRRLAGNRLCAVPNGFDIARIDRVASQARRQRVGTGEFRVICVSRLVGIKNLFSVVAAFKESASQTSRLILVGDGPLHTSLSAASKEGLREGQVEFTGIIPREQVYERLLSSDLFVSASQGEGLPVAVLEAMACSCPVLLSDIAPHREICAGADFIPLIPPNDVEALSREITRFKAMSCSEREAIGHKCRQLVEDRYSLKTMHAGYAQVYAQLTDVGAPQ